MQKNFLLPLVGVAASTLATAQVYYGTDDAAAMDNFRLDVPTGVSTGPVWTGATAWGLADDDVNQVMYIINGSSLRAWPYGSASPATIIGTTTYQGAAKAYVSAAHHNGVLYVNPNLTIEGIYSVDVVTATATLIHTFFQAAMDLGGLDFDPATGLLYGSNDSGTYTDPQGTVGRGIIVFDLFAPTITEVNTHPYPSSAAGAQLTDVDGLAFDPSGVVYMLEDNPAPLHRYIIASGMYDANPPLNSILGSETFSSGTYTTFSGGGSLGTNYCTAVANSTGSAASMSATGSASVAANSLTLQASSLPQNAFGFFLTSLTQGFVANPGGSQGNLCLSGSIGRYVGPGQVQNSGAGGAIALAVDLTQHPTPTGFVSVQVGETWNFTAWYRDAVGGSATSNFADGYEIVFN
jgi:hypothetical protein